MSLAFRSARLRGGGAYISAAINRLLKHFNLCRLLRCMSPFLALRRSADSGSACQLPRESGQGLLAASLQVIIGAVVEQTGNAAQDQRVVVDGRGPHSCKIPTDARPSSPGLVPPFAGAHQFTRAKMAELKSRLHRI
jgi:hypothetical protein